MSHPFIVTICTLDADNRVIVEFQQAASDEQTLKAAVVGWMRQHFSDHFEEGMFHDSPSDSVADNYHAITLWCDYADSAGGLQLILRPADG